MILGDLHFYDDEYNDAIIEYKDSVQFIRGVQPEKLTISMVVLLIRVLLKIGLCYEKRKTYDSAFLVYAELTDMLISYRNIDLSQLGLDECLDSEGNHFVVYQEDKKSRQIINKEIKPLSNHFQTNYRQSADKLVASLHETLSPVKENILNKIAAFEGLRIIYQPLLAKLQILEKSHLGGITAIDITRLEAEYNFLQRAISYRDKYIMTSEFHSKLGDILYYKNGRLNSEQPVRDHKPFGEFCIKGSRKSGENQCCLTPCSACCYYTSSLKKYVFEAILQHKEIAVKPEYNNFDPCDELISFIVNGDRPGIGSDSLTILANTLSNLADVYFGCSEKDTKIDGEYMKDFLKFMKLLQEDPTVQSIQSYQNEVTSPEPPAVPKEQGENGPAEQIGTQDKKSPTDLAFEMITFETKLSAKNNILHRSLLLCFLSAHFYKKANEHRQSIWQYTKILYILNSYLSNDPNSEIKGLVTKKVNQESIEDQVLNVAIAETFLAYENIHHSEIERFKMIFDRTGRKQNIPLSMLTLNHDLTEPLTLFSYLELNSTKFSTTNQQNQKVDMEGKNSHVQFLRQAYFGHTAPSPFQTSSIVYNKITLLRFKSIINYKIFLLLTDIKGYYIENLSTLNKILVEKILKNPNTASFNKFWPNFAEQNFNESDKSRKIEKQVHEQDETNKPTKQHEGLEEFMKIRNTEFLLHLITDSIYCLLEIISSMNTYGKSYILSASYQATIHESLAEWCYYYKIIEWELRRSTPSMYRFREELVRLIGEENLNFISPNYHCEMARSLFISSLETHSQGRYYQNVTEDMTLLNEDFSDNTYHFFAALERFCIGSGKIDKKLVRVSRMYRNSAIYSCRNYYDEKK